MGLLDDAIREHLDLKRRHGADPSELERAEQEALGPVRRDPFESGEGGREAEAARPALDEDEGVFDDEYYEDEEFEEEEWDEPVGGEEPPLPPEKSGPVVDVGEPTRLHAVDEAAVEEPLPLPPLDPSAPAPHGAVADEESPVAAPGRALADEEPPLAAPERAPADEEPPLSPAERGQVGEETVEYEIKQELGAEEDRLEVEPPHGSEPAERRGVEGAPDERAGHPPAEPGRPGEDDVLEETPEFLQDTPDHDRLWFEQRPPRDFDFDG